MPSHELDSRHNDGIALLAAQAAERGRKLYGASKCRDSPWRWQTVNV